MLELYLQIVSVIMLIFFTFGVALDIHSAILKEVECEIYTVLVSGAGLMLSVTLGGAWFLTYVTFGGLNG